MLRHNRYDDCARQTRVLNAVASTRAVAFSFGRLSAPDRSQTTWRSDLRNAASEPFRRLPKLCRIAPEGVQYPKDLCSLKTSSPKNAFSCGARRAVLTSFPREGFRTEGEPRRRFGLSICLLISLLTGLSFSDQVLDLGASGLLIFGCGLHVLSMAVCAYPIGAGRTAAHQEARHKKAGRGGCINFAQWLREVKV